MVVFKKKFEFRFPELYFESIIKLDRVMRYFDSVCELVEEHRDISGLESIGVDYLANVLGNHPSGLGRSNTSDYGWPANTQIKHDMYIFTPGEGSSEVVLTVEAYKLNYEKDFEEFKKEWIRSATNEKA